MGTRVAGADSRIGVAARLARVGLVAGAVLTVLLVVDVSVSSAALNSVFTDGSDNLSVEPTPFGGHAPTGSFNTALGFDALMQLTSGENNVASGIDALKSTTTGEANAATGPKLMRCC